MQVETSLREVAGVLRSEAWLETDGGRARVQCTVSETEARRRKVPKEAQASILRYSSIVITKN